jgi:flagellar hook-associated protein 1 FlgK
MDLIHALGTSLSGLNAAQANLGIVAGNVANSQTPGYIARSASQIVTTSGDGSESVRISSINRLLDGFVQAQLRTETAGGAYADIQAKFYEQLQQVYGQPGTDASLDGVLNKFTAAAQSLATSPSSVSVQAATINAAQALVQQLNGATSSIQGLRTQADQAISDDVQQVNNALKQIADINQHVAGTNANDSAAAALEDQRDQAIDTIAKLLDIRVSLGSDNQVSIFTASGTSLLTQNEAGTLNFSAVGTVTATRQWNANPAKSTLSTISLTAPDGATTDLVANRAIRSGEIAGYLNLRDSVLVQAQGQVDELAAQMSRALSDTTTPGTAVSAPPQSGFSVDIANVSPGNSVNLTYTDALNVQHKVTVIRVDDPTALPLSNSVTPDPNDTVIGVNFTGGPASVAAQLNAALGATGLQFSNPGGTTLQVLNDVANTISVNSASTTTTATSLTGSVALPMFVDGTVPFTGAITGLGSETVGFAGRIAVNGGLITDPTKLVIYQPSTSIGDPTRPNFISHQLSDTLYTYSPGTGIGGSGSPFQGTLSSYLGQVLSTQGQATATAQNLQTGQDVVVNSLKARFDATSGVNVDTELANLLTLQNAYGANARVMTTVKQMLDTLLQL